jgi:CheY-like chemotaxis protein/HPt (histidine-containing phosphotransfer) domain-containing protein
LARVKGERFDLVLMDLEMPIMDGIDAARQIRVWERDREAAPTPIVALTAHALDTYREQCHLAGMNGFVTKPLRSEELVEVARTYTKRRSRILIVEDSDDMRMVTRRFLHSAGYEVHVARDGAEGLSMLTCLDPDLVLLDMSMPIMDGYETAAAIRALVGFEKIPILAMTAYVGRQEQTRCLSAGCTAYLAKPVSREQLLDAVNDNLQIDPGSERSVAGTTQFPAAAPLAVSRAHMRSYDPGTSRIPIAIDEDILELVPLFLAEREADVAALEVTLENGSFEAARRIGHQLKGNGGAYGFSWLSELGTALEVAAIAESASDISLAKDYLTRYLSLVEIISE